MSVWTYISGSVDLERDPFKYKLEEDGSIKYYPNGYKEWGGFAKLYLPYPDEQFKIRHIDAMCRTKKIDRREQTIAGYGVKVELTSYPIIKRLIEKYIFILPSGENKVLNYSLVKDTFIRSSSGSPSSPQVDKIFKTEILNKIDAYTKNWKEFTKYTPIELWEEDHNENSILTLHDSIRYCEASDLYLKLIEFLKILVKEGIILNRGSFYFEDLYKHTYMIIINGDRIEVTIEDYDWKTETKSNPRKEYYQVFQNKDKSDKNKRFPYTYELIKVDSFIKDSYPELGGGN